MANKGIMYIDGQRVPFDGEPNVLTVIRKAGIEMPTFCYYSDLSVYGACRCLLSTSPSPRDNSQSRMPSSTSNHTPYTTLHIPQTARLYLN